MKWTAVEIVSVVCLLFGTGCTSLPRQRSENVDPKALIGNWESVGFEGLCAHDFSSETFTFRSDFTFEEQTTFTDGVQSQLDGKYRIDGQRLVLEEGIEERCLVPGESKEYTTSVPFYLGDDVLLITRRANLGRVKVTFQRAD